MEVHGKSVEFKYTCQYCNEVFPLKEMFDYHIKSKHERSVSYFRMYKIIYTYYRSKKIFTKFGGLIQCQMFFSILADIVEIVFRKDEL